MKSFNQIKEDYAQSLIGNKRDLRLKTAWRQLEYGVFTLNNIDEYYTQAAILYAEQFFNAKKLNVYDIPVKTFDELLIQTGDIKV